MHFMPFFAARITLLAAMLCLVSMPLAYAQQKILVESEIPNLCRPQSPGSADPWVVDTVRLAWAVIRELKAPIQKVSCIDSVVANCEQTASMPTEEQVLKVLSKRNPFPGDDAKALNEELDYLLYEQIDTPLFAPSKAEKKFTVKTKDFPSNVEMATSSLVKYSQNIWLECPNADARAKIAADAKGKAAAEAKVAALSKKLAVRATEKDLAVPRGSDAFSTLNAAEFSFTDDEFKETQAINIKGALGYKMNDNKNWENYLVATYERTGFDSDNPANEKPGTKDVSALTAGITFVYFPTEPALGGFTAALSPQLVLDFENNAEKVKLGITAPYSGRAGPISFGARNDVLNGQFRFTPEFALLGEFAHVIDGGKTILKDSEDFAGVGGRVGVKIAFPKVAFLSRFSFNTSYRYLAATGTKSDVNDITTFESKAVYQFPENPNLSLSVGYTEGENPTTFDYQQYWSMAIGYKF
jgi:hypothetical protein